MAMWPYEKISYLWFNDIFNAAAAVSAPVVKFIVSSSRFKVEVLLPRPYYALQALARLHAQDGRSQSRSHSAHAGAARTRHRRQVALWPYEKASYLWFYENFNRSQLAGPFVTFVLAPNRLDVKHDSLPMTSGRLRQTYNVARIISRSTTARRGEACRTPLSLPLLATSRGQCEDWPAFVTSATAQMDSTTIERIIAGRLINLKGKDARKTALPLIFEELRASLSENPDAEAAAVSERGLGADQGAR